MRDLPPLHRSGAERNRKSRYPDDHSGSTSSGSEADRHAESFSAESTYGRQCGSA